VIIDLLADVIGGELLTKDIDVAPHGEDLIFEFPLVGRPCF
jgi:predicted heme/steroid binding protein